MTNDLVVLFEHPECLATRSGEPCPNLNFKPALQSGTLVAELEFGDSFADLTDRQNTQKHAALASHGEKCSDPRVGSFAGEF
jgi:hypothetical protein